MIARILLAVDDSPASLAAVRLTSALAAALHARLRVVHVAVDHELGAALRRASANPHPTARVLEGQQALLTRLSTLAGEFGVEVEVGQLTGDVAPALLLDARRWGADLIVIGRSARSTGDPYVGSHARQVLEFAELPVVVVPPPSAHAR
jgi:nucleotide-binding universal stress UspA family protein